MGEQSLWWRRGVIYQIYPRSFADSNQDGIGDLPGILSKLDYLVDLGIDAIWLSPIYPSPDADFGYDVADYFEVDPRYGRMQDLDNLIREAHRRGIRIILDLVLNHTSDRHPWFLQSRQSRDNPYRDWYIWRQGRNGAPRPPNNWESAFGGKAWQYDRNTGEYYLHTFYTEQPDLNWHNPQVRRAILDVFEFWLKRGVDGFRLDVFNAYFKHPDLPDNPHKIGLRGYDRQHHLYDSDQPEMLPFLAEMRELLDAYPERYVIGETFNATTAKAAGYCGPDRLHAAFNFDFTHSRWNPRKFLRVITEWERLLGPQNWPNYVLNNHDLPRLPNRIQAGDRDDRLMVAAAMLLTLRGTPYLYYGEEIGMRNISVPRSQILDPIGKKYWPFYRGRDGCRSPMQWDATQYAGFSQVSPWLPVHPNYRERNVATQRSEPGSLFNFYRKLLALRRQFPALVDGAFLPLASQPDGVMVYLRQSLDQVALVALNFTRRSRTIALPADLAGSDWQVLLSNRREALPGGTGKLTLAPQEATILGFSICNHPSGNL